MGNTLPFAGIFALSPRRTHVRFSPFLADIGLNIAQVRVRFGGKSGFAGDFIGSQFHENAAAASADAFASY